MLNDENQRGRVNRVEPGDDETEIYRLRETDRDPRDRRTMYSETG